jgi:hypothetical protein
MSKRNKTICLNMIVKNEEHIIAETLKHLHGIFNFDYWVISDTGSTDRTKEIIKDFFKDNNVRGDLVENEWKGFGPSRTDAMNAAYNKTDYLLIFDADDVIRGDFKLPDNLTEDWYSFNFFEYGILYNRPLLINNRKRWKYKGIIHNVLVSIDNTNSPVLIKGDYYVESRRLGNFNLDPDKYSKQARMLEKEYEKELMLKQDMDLVYRYAFYCARSYNDANEKDNALIWFKKVVEELDNWSQEKYYSCIALGNIYKNKNDLSNALHYYLKSIEYDNERIEGISYTIDLLRNNKLDRLAVLLYDKYKNYNKNINTSDKLFVNISVYENMDMEFNTSIIAYYMDSEHKLGYECCKKIINNKNFNAYNYLRNILNITLPNFKKFILQDTLSNIITMFTSLTEYITHISKKETDMSKYIDVFNLWNYILSFTPEESIENKELLQATKIITKYNEANLKDVVAMISNYTFNTKEHYLTNVLYNKYKNIKLTDTNKHDYFMIRHYNSISASYIIDTKNGYECCKELILNNIDFDKKNLYSNMRFYIKEIENDNEAERKQLLKKYYLYLSTINDSKYMTQLTQFIIPYMLKYNKEYLVKNNKEFIIFDENENKRIDALKINTKQTYDFGIIKTTEYFTDRIQNVIDELKSQAYSINIIDILSEEKDVELLKCKQILNIFDSSTDSTFLHIIYDILLIYDFNVLSEFDPTLSEEYKSKYTNLRFIKYEDFFDKIRMVEYFNNCFSKYYNSIIHNRFITTFNTMKNN